MAQQSTAFPSTPYTSIPEDQFEALHAADGKLRLFNNIVCPFGHRALWTALEVNAPFEVIEVSLLEKPASYAEKFNRYGTVPFLLDNGFPVYESSIVAQYLDAKYGNGDLWRTKDPQGASLANLLSAKLEVGPFYAVLRTGEEKAKEELRSALSEIEAIYRDDAKAFRAQGPYLLGAELSSADINLAPFLFRFEILLAHYRNFSFLADCPSLKALLDAVKTRPAFQKSIRPPEVYINGYSKYVTA
ncbi:unnamed protein product [Aphanomyces euteiches]|uniref:GST N-terminal domain-containing protein n=1 Tax=Aphanomyces euteiches TaxID=100861 RepID=A0A6G0X825_9STRA|nr:hypothetical protein Ae201684_007229 [Aphanomyces euteiches]KAH9100680.1 hypothetical protein Ae201684P_006875 [Aphanomyces euteiches]KAH9146546.1 hypothetical protein AeRB84_009569 [Aphanomyces euteiches]